jgi:hypothetical protein
MFMAKARTSSTIIDKAFVRVQGMRAISPTLDLGSGLSVVAIEAAINDTRAKLDACIRHLSKFEELQAAFEDAEKHLNELTTRILNGAASKYGRDSIEYAQVGGTRSRDIKRSPRRPKTPKSTAPQ